MWFLRGRGFFGSGDQSRDRGEEEQHQSRLASNYRWLQQRPTTSMMGARQSTTSHHDTFQVQTMLARSSSTAAAAKPSSPDASTISDEDLAAAVHASINDDMDTSEDSETDSSTSSSASSASASSSSSSLLDVEMGEELLDAEVAQLAADEQHEMLAPRAEVSPSSEACSSSSTSSSSGAANSGLPAGGSSSTSTSATCPRGGAQPSGGSSGSSGGGGSGRPTVSSRDRRSIQSTRSAQLRSLSPAFPSPYLDDMLRPERFHRIMRMPAPDRFVQEQHSWNPDDRSLNIIVKEEDKFTFHRHPVAQSTDCIRGKIGYSRGFHVWQIEWPERQRGTHAVVGVATKTAPLHATGYTALIGTTTESYGWDITRKECHHDSKHTMTWGYPGNSRETNYVVPDKFYCILDMDEGYMAFATDHEYLGVAFRNLKGKTLYPIVAAVWGHCEISMRYLGSLEPAPLSLSELCRRRVRIQLGAESEQKIEQLGLPPYLKQYLMYRY